MPRLVALVLLVLGAAAQAATWTVRPGETIQAALEQAAPGDVIEVQPGQYRGNLVIAKPVTLRGQGKPTISGSLQGDTIRVKSTDVTIEGLIVRDSGDSLLAQNAGIYVSPGSHRAVVRRNDLVYNLFGLWIEKANDVRVEDNIIVGKRDYGSAQRGDGVQLYNTTGARIERNHISFVRDALYVDVSHDAIFRGNRLHHSRYGTHYMNSYRNLWEDNDSYLNRGGLALMEVRDQVVRNNRAWGNSDHGIMLRTLQDSASRTTWSPATRAASSSTTWSTPPWRAISSSTTRWACTWPPARRATRWTATTSSATASRCATSARRTKPGAASGQLLEQLPRLGPRRQRRATCATKPTTWWTGWSGAIRRRACCWPARCRRCAW